MSQYLKGEIYFIEFKDSVGSEQREDRPAIVFQNIFLNDITKTTIVIPLTKSLSMKEYSECVFIPKSSNCGLKEDSVALCFQINTVSHKRFKSFIGKVTSTTLEQLDKAVKCTLRIK